MTDNQPSVIIVRDDEGRAHFTSPHSALAKKYAKPEVPEVPDAPEPPQQGDDLDTGAVDTGSGQRKRKAGTTGSAVRGSGEDQPESGR